MNEFGKTADDRRQLSLCVFLRGDDDIHQLSATSTVIEGVARNGSGSINNYTGTATAGGAAAVLTHY